MKGGLNIAYLCVVHNTLMLYRMNKEMRQLFEELWVWWIDSLSADDESKRQPNIVHISTTKTWNMLEAVHKKIIRTYKNKSWKGSAMPFRNKIFKTINV